MSKAPAEFEHGDVARLRRIGVIPRRDLESRTHDPFEIPLGVAMQVPIWWIKRYVDMRDDAGLFVDLGEQCQTIGTSAFDPRHMMVGRAQPPQGFLGDRKSPGIGRGLRLGDYGSASRIDQTAVSGVGI